MRNARHHDRHARASDQRLERITRSKRQRARSAREKVAIVAEAFHVRSPATPGSPGLLFSWRRQVRRARPSPVVDATSEEGRDPVFVPVEVEGADGWPAGPTVSNARSPTPMATAPMIEIVMATMTVRVPSGVDAATLATVLATLGLA